MLDGMAAQGWLDPGRPRDARSSRGRWRARRCPAGVPGDSRGHIVSAVTAELESLGITEQDLAQEGLRITTTIDPAARSRPSPPPTRRSTASR